jgi:colicin import membrane protein
VPLAKPEAPRVVYTQRPPTKPQPREESRAFDPTRIAALLDRAPEPAAASAPAPVEESAPVMVAAVIAPSAPRPAANARLTISERDAVRYAVERSWSFDPGVRNIANLVVTVRIFLDATGALARAPEIVEAAKLNDPAFRAFAESTVRAVQKAAPYTMLPSAKYESWHEIELSFTARDMVR